MNGKADYKDIILELAEKVNVRTNLSQLRQLLKDDKIKEDLTKTHDLGENVVGFLEEEDPKTRKNAVLLLGDLGYQEAASAIMEAYQKEDTRFVKASYVTALAQLDAEE